MAGFSLDDPPQYDLLRIVPTQYTANGDEIPSTVGQRVEDKVSIQREIGVTVPSGMRELVRKLRDTNDQHNRIETTEIPDFWKKQKDKLERWDQNVHDALAFLLAQRTQQSFYPIVGVSYFGGASASNATIESDLAWLCGFRWKSVRVGVVWRPEDGGSVIGSGGVIDDGKLETLRFLISLATARGMSVDLTVFGPEIDSYGSLVAGLTNLCGELADLNGWFIDVLNEHILPSSGLAGPSEIKELLEAAQAGGASMVTASMSGSVSTIADTYIADLDGGAPYSFLTPHGERTNDWDTAGPERMTELLGATAAAGYQLRAHMQEESRFGIPNDTVTGSANFLASIEGARQAGALGVNFHTTAGYNLTGGTMESQCNATEIDVIETGVDAWLEP